MSPEELSAELKYRIEERLAILCGPCNPTLAQRLIAEEEAQAWVRAVQTENRQRSTPVIVDCLSGKPKIVG